MPEASTARSQGLTAVGGWTSHTSAGGAGQIKYPSDAIGGAANAQSASIFEDPDNATNFLPGSTIRITGLIRDLEALLVDAATPIKWEFRHHDGSTLYNPVGGTGLGAPLFMNSTGDFVRDLTFNQIIMRDGFSSERITVTAQTLHIFWRATRVILP